MFICYGTRYYGKVKSDGDESIQTKFAHIYWLPLIPAGSFYVTGKDGKSVRGFPMRISGQSVLAAYLRSWGLLSGIIAAFITLHTLSDPETPVQDVQGLITVSVISIGLWLWSAFFLGRRSTRERMQGALMQKLVGFRAMPEWLSPAFARQVASKLETDLGELRIPIDPKELTQIEAMDLQAIVLAYVYGRFQGAIGNRRAWMPVVERCWRQIRQRAVLEV